MKILNIVLAGVGLSAMALSAPLRATEKADGTCACSTDTVSEVAPKVTMSGGKASRSHAWARAAAADADKAAELRAAKRAEDKARKIANGEKPVDATPVVVAPVKVSGGSGGGKASAGHMRARVSKAEATQAAAQDAE